MSRRIFAGFLGVLVFLLGLVVGPLGVKISAQRFLGRDLHDYVYLLSSLLPRWLLGNFCDRRPTLPGRRG